MDEKLREELSNMTDEEFFEVMRNMEISRDLRDLMQGEEPFTEEEIKKRLDITPFDMMYIFNGAFEFTTRHMGILDVMKEEYAWRNYEPADASDDDGGDVEEQTNIPPILNYGIFEDRNPLLDDDEVIQLSESRELTRAELDELEKADLQDIQEGKEKYSETTEQLSARLQKEYQEKISKQQAEAEKEKLQQQQGTHKTIVTFD